MVARRAVRGPHSRDALQPFTPQAVALRVGGKCGWEGHDHLWFYRDAIEGMLSVGDAPGALRYVTRLEEYTRVEPLPWAGLFAARGRVLALCLQGGADNATQRELEHIGAVLREARFTRPEPRLRGGDRWTHSSSL
jgi:hypothetical protein